MKKRGVISLAFLWHMHQPDYKDKLSGRYILPWVRLHALKDYYDMVALLDEFPKIKQTFNLVPSLIDQLAEYAEGATDEVYLDLAKMPAGRLEKWQKNFILQNFFHGNLEYMIKKFPRYYELYKRRGYKYTTDDFDMVSKVFSEQDFRDLAVFFHLSWTDPMFFEKNEWLKEMAAKDGGYTEEEKSRLLELQHEIIGQVLPMYRRMEEKGRIEISVTPYYHPILPLLCNHKSAMQAMPNVTLPKIPFSHLEDAGWHVAMAQRRFTEVFGHPARGMWPAEGSISDEIIPIIAAEGIGWIASDQDVLYNSMRQKANQAGRRALCCPYRLHYKDSSVVCFFRDRILSDRIGFGYQHLDYRSAVKDFMERLHEIADGAGDTEDGKSIVSVILDGENAWEGYPNDGHDFLRLLYETLTNDEQINCVTFSEYLERFEPEETLDHVVAGSWINANFGVWIGGDEENLAWDLLSQARQKIVDSREAGLVDEDTYMRAMSEIYSAEGSDWFWWFDDDHTSPLDHVFDQQFRQILMNAYKIIGEPAPSRLEAPIMLGERHFVPDRLIRGFVHPVIDGRLGSYFQWENAAYANLSRFGGVMHQGEKIIRSLFYGLDISNLYLRLDFNPEIDDSKIEELTVQINFVETAELRFDIRLSVSDSLPIILPPAAGEDVSKAKDEIKAAFQDILEIQIPVSALGPRELGNINFYINILDRQSGVDRIPPNGVITCMYPDPDFEKRNWTI